MTLRAATVLLLLGLCCINVARKRTLQTLSRQIFASAFVGTVTFFGDERLLGALDVFLVVCLACATGVIPKRTQAAYHRFSSRLFGLEVIRRFDDPVERAEREQRYASAFEQNVSLRALSHKERAQKRV